MNLVGKDEDEQVVSLLEEAPRPSDAARLSSSPRIVTALYCSTMAINGGCAAREAWR